MNTWPQYKIEFMFRAEWHEHAKAFVDELQSISENVTVVAIEKITVTLPDPTPTNWPLDDATIDRCSKAAHDSMLTFTKWNDLSNLGRDVWRAAIREAFDAREHATPKAEQEDAG